MIKTIPSESKIEVKNYPYGFKLRCTLFDYLEFDPKKGFRHCTQTIDPRNGRQNKPKKSTYYRIMLRYFNNDDHIKTLAFNLESFRNINDAMEVINENFSMFPQNQILYVYSELIKKINANMMGAVIYGGGSLEKLHPILFPVLEKLNQGWRTAENVLNGLSIDLTAIEQSKIS